MRPASVMSAPCESRVSIRSRVRIDSSAPRGARSITRGEPRSTPSARAGGPSVTRLIHRSWSGSRAGFGEMSAVVKTIRTSDMLHDSRNRITLRRFSKTMRPCRTASTMVAKLSSARTMSAASRDTSVPMRPIATPMSARLRAGASFTPSPVIATTCPRALSASTMRSLCSGFDARVDADPVHRVCELLVAHALQLDPGHDALPLDQPDLEPDRAGRQRVVAGDHSHVDPGAVALVDRLGHLRPRRVQDRGDADVGQVALELLALGGLVGRERAHGEWRACGTRSRRGPRLSRRAARAAPRSSVPSRRAVARTCTGASTTSAPPFMYATRSSSRECTVVIRLRSESNGTSPRRFGRTLRSGRAGSRLRSARSRWGRRPARPRLCSGRRCRRTLSRGAGRGPRPAGPAPSG